MFAQLQPAAKGLTLKVYVLVTEVAAVKVTLS